MGFPIQKSPDHRIFAASPELFAGYHVFHRLWLPRHPPHALNYLTIQPQTVVYPTSRISNRSWWFFITLTQLASCALKHCTASIRFIYQNAWFSLIASNSSISQTQNCFFVFDFNEYEQFISTQIYSVNDLLPPRQRVVNCDKSQRLITMPRIIRRFLTKLYKLSNRLLNVWYIAKQCMVETRRVELLTSCVQSRRSTN